MTKEKQASLENLVEAGDLNLEILHPGGLAITRELAELCRIGPETRVLEVASGTGESACYLAETFGCHVVGIDGSAAMIERSQTKARAKNLLVEFRQADAHNLPFDDNTFDVVTCECTVCALDKERALREMTRVAKHGGYVGIHDLCWKESAPENLKSKLVELEGERPESLAGWKRLFESVGMGDVCAIDRSDLIPSAMRDMRRQLGIIGQVKLAVRAVGCWGAAGLYRVVDSERLLRSAHMGYGIIVGRKPRPSE